MQGAASAYLAAVDRVGWASEAPHIVTTINGTTLDLLEMAPKMVREWAADDLATAQAARSTIALNMNDLKGERGYRIGLDAAAGGGNSVRFERRRWERRG